MNPLTKNFNWLFFDKILRILGGIFIGIWVARYLGPYDFGIINYAMAIISFLVFLPNLGLEQIVVRELTQKPENENQILGTAFILKLIGAFIAFLILLFMIFQLSEGYSVKIVLFILSFSFFFQSFEVVNYYYQTIFLSKYVIISRNIAFIITSFLKLILILYNCSIVYFALIITVDMIIFSFLLLYIYESKTGNLKKWRFNKQISVELFKYSWPLMFSTLIITVHTNIDQVMIDNYLNKENVGIYSVAVKLSRFWLFLPTIVVSTLLPYFVKLRTINQEEFESKLLQLYSVMFWLGFFVGCVTFVFGEYIVVTLYGEPYKNAFHALTYNIWSGIFISQAIARGIWMVTENLQRYRLYINLIAIFLNIVGNIILIPLLGITGAAISTLATQVLCTWFFPFFWKPLRISNWNLIKSCNPIYLKRRENA